METLTIKIPDDKRSIVKQVLKELGVTIVTASKNNTLTLSADQKAEIASSQNQINNGLFVEQSAMDDEIEAWLEK
jgi:hypothetical protein